MTKDQIAAETAQKIYAAGIMPIAPLTAIIKAAIEKALAPVEKVRDEWCDEYMKVRDQLAIEREKHGDEMTSVQLQLETQLAAERKKVHRCEVIHRHAETIELLNKQLAAERENGDELWKNSAWKQVQQLREQLAAEREKVKELTELLGRMHVDDGFTEFGIKHEPL